MKRNLKFFLAVGAVALLGFSTLLPGSETRQDYIIYSGSVDFTTDSTTTKTTEGFYIGSLYDQAAYIRAQVDSIVSGTHDVNVYVDFSVDNGQTWDQYASAAIDSVSHRSPSWDTLSTIGGVAPVQWKMAKYFRLRFDPQSGHRASRVRYTVKIPRTDRQIRSDNVLN